MVGLRLLCNLKFPTEDLNFKSCKGDSETMSLKTFFVTALTASDDSARDSLGDVRQEGGKRYKYVKFITGSVIVGDVVKYASLAGYDASEVAPSATAALVVAGVAVAAQAIDDFGWIQIGGESDPLAVDITGAPVIGSNVVSSATTKAFAVGAGELASYGVALDLTNPDVVLLSCPD